MNSAVASPSIPLPPKSANSGWADRYGAKHRLIRVTYSEAADINLPKAVRIYRRAKHHVLQWWEPSHKKTLSLRVNGDLIDAVARGREIETRLIDCRSSGHVPGRLTHVDLVTAYLEDLAKRANADEIDQRTVERYRAPLQCHYLAFAAEPDVARHYRYVGDINRDFQLSFARFLQSRNVASNGRSRGSERPMRGQRYVLDTVRAMFHWAADAQRGNLLPVGFINPFRRTQFANDRRDAQNLLQPDISMEMAADLLSICDEFQLPIFATLALYGLRPAELGWLFREDLKDNWLRVVSQPELAYTTKGRRDKQFPFLDCLRLVWPREGSHLGEGLIFHRRNSALQPSLMVATRQSLARRFQLDLATTSLSAALRRRRRDSVLASAGQLTYDHIRLEFGKLARPLRWPVSATMKDFRHLFATSLENAGVP
jgi:hypothetical protein